MDGKSISCPAPLLCSFHVQVWLIENILSSVSLSLFLKLFFLDPDHQLHFGTLGPKLCSFGPSPDLLSLIVTFLHSSLSVSPQAPVSACSVYTSRLEGLLNSQYHGFHGNCKKNGIVHYHQEAVHWP